MAKYLDQDGLKYYTKKIKDGTIVAGKCLASGIQGVIDISHIPQGALIISSFFWLTFTWILHILFSGRFWLEYLRTPLGGEGG